MGALQQTLKTQILTAYNSVSDKDGDPAAFRDSLATAISTAIDTHSKALLTQTLTAGVAIPQDGGTALKTSAIAAITAL